MKHIPLSLMAVLALTACGGAVTTLPTPDPELLAEGPNDSFSGRTEQGSLTVSSTLNTISRVSSPREVNFNEDVPFVLELTDLDTDTPSARLILDGQDMGSSPLLDGARFAFNGDGLFSGNSDTDLRDTFLTSGERFENLFAGTGQTNYVTSLYYADSYEEEEVFYSEFGHGVIGFRTPTDNIDTGLNCNL